MKMGLVAFCHVRWEQKGSVWEIPFPAQHFISPCQNILFFCSQSANFCECVTNSDKNCSELIADITLTVLLFLFFFPKHKINCGD